MWTSVCVYGAVLMGWCWTIKTISADLPVKSVHSTLQLLNHFLVLDTEYFPRIYSHWISSLIYIWTLCLTHIVRGPIQSNIFLSLLKFLLCLTECFVPLLLCYTLRYRYSFCKPCQCDVLFLVLQVSFHTYFWFGLLDWIDPITHLLYTPPLP